MGRVERNFENNPEWVRAWMIENTWCEQCGKSDLGLTNPKEYEVDGRVFVEGLCAACGGRVVSEIVEANRHDG